MGDPKRQPCLAATPRPGQHHQSVRGYPLLERRQLLVAAHEAVDLGWRLCRQPSQGHWPLCSHGFRASPSFMSALVSMYRIAVADANGAITRLAPVPGQESSFSCAHACCCSCNTSASRAGPLAVNIPRPPTLPIMAKIPRSPGREARFYSHDSQRLHFRRLPRQQRYTRIRRPCHPSARPAPAL